MFLNQLLRLTGYINKTGIVGWNTNSITIVPYVLEPGNTVFAGEPMPYNFSMPNAHGDFYNVTNGFYNISLPAAAEVSNMILFATAANSSIYYGAFRNLSLSLGDASQQLNFSMQGLFGNPLNISNSTCDVPSPPTACNLGNSATMDSFNPIRSVFGGGAISFRMGIGNVKIHYVNVDMIASGPPDALFDDSTTNAGSSSSFDQALRFGSGGPTIYDYVLVSIPYSETAGSGLNENGEVNMSIPVLYDDNWNIAWNTTTNGTSSTSLAGNYSHYSNKATDWSTLMSLTT